MHRRARIASVLVALLSAAVVGLGTVAAAPAFAAPPKCTIVGTAGNDHLRGTAGPDVICGRGGDDVLLGLGGEDILRGGRGDDVLIGGAGLDTLIGGPGEDQLEQGAPGQVSYVLENLTGNGMFLEVPERSSCGFPRGFGVQLANGQSVQLSSGWPCPSDSKLELVWSEFDCTFTSRPSIDCGTHPGRPWPNVGFTSLGPDVLKLTFKP